MRRVFFSFDWDDAWKVNQVRHSWLTTGVEAVGFIDAADIEQVKRASHQAIQNWIDMQMKSTSVTAVLIGENTHRSRWVKYEIKKSIDKRNGILEIYIHNVKDRFGRTSFKGKSPFEEPPFNWRASHQGELAYPCCCCYDWVSGESHQNVGDWIERAAQQAGR
ncbi:MAG: TIR domain-containing protein [Deltaproteobacteria bacterium]|nr:TIR domain-containing protein [Deltaproteobacteria bacterium]